MDLPFWVNLRHLSFNKRIVRLLGEFHIIMLTLLKFNDLLYFCMTLLLSLLSSVVGLPLCDFIVALSLYLFPQLVIT
jgi:hypothetical protein